MIITTTPTVEGKIVGRYCGVVGTEVIFGAMFLKDILASGVDFLGGRNETYERVFEDARINATKEIKIKAEAMGADAVVNLKFAYQVLGEKNGMMMVAATGTAVCLTLSKGDRELLESDEKKNLIREVARFYLNFNRVKKGPFSINQMAQMVASEKIHLSDFTYSESSNQGLTVGELLG